MPVGNNGIFRWTDPHAFEVGGYHIPYDWWSRRYEYPWAIQFALPGMAVADMGAGWMSRPFMYALADIVDRVYAVDIDARLRELSVPENVELLVADFTKVIPAIKPRSLDRVFCISVLEDVPNLTDALREFGRVLARDGRIVITCDTRHEDDKPLGQYPGVHIGRLLDAVDDAGLAFDGSFDFDRTGAVYHDGFNLCVIHAVLKHAK